MSDFNIESIPSQNGRVAIVTGSNTGLGFETAMALAKKEMKVILACRNNEKAEKAKQLMLKKVPGADLEVRIIDLSSLKSVREFAKNFLNDYDKLDLLINNAGIMIPPYSKTEDGFESQMGANYFSHFLLTGLLIDVITKTPGSRIVTLSSIAHKNGQINFEDLHWEKKYSAINAYRQSKLACLMFACELKRRLEKAGSKTLSLAAHPGVSNTELARHIPKLVLYPLMPVFLLLSHTPDKGALPTLMAALSENAQSGDYYGPQGFREMKGKPGKAFSSDASRDQDVARRLWDISEELTGIKYL